MSAWSTGAWLLFGTGILDATILLVVIAARRVHAGRQARIEWIRHFMRVAFPTASAKRITQVVARNPDAFLRMYMELEDAIQLPQSQRRKVQEALVAARQFPRLIRRLGSRRTYLRTRSAIWLGYAAPESATVPLIRALERERSPAVRLHIAHSLVSLGDPAVIPSLVDTLSGADETYQERIRGLLATFGVRYTEYFEVLRHRNEPEIQRLCSHLAAAVATDSGRYYLTQLLESTDRVLRRLAAKLLLDAYIFTIDPAVLLGNEDLLIVNLAVEALGRLRSTASLDRLVAAAGEPTTRKSAIVGLSNLVHDTPRLFNAFIERLRTEENPIRRDALLEVVSQRVEYLLERLLRDDRANLRQTLVDLVASGRVSGLIAFLSRNTDPAAERRIIDAIGETVRTHEQPRREFTLYAEDNVIERIGIERQEVNQARGKRVGEATRPILVLSIIASTVVLPPAAFLAVRWLGGAVPSWGWISDYVNGFERFFGVYAFTLNMIYLTLLGAAAGAVARQQRFLELKPLSLLFRPAMLPSVSIVVPAYGEEATIVENINSLMNLRYPDYELIVVNDGSPDRTLEVLISTFELERTDVFIHGYLSTQPIRGIYRNPRIPELLVIDKQNGGKADSLNAGINASRKQYFAAIDSDSLLERDSLLRLTAGFLDSDVPVVAAGGNIFPVNGCRVDRGHLDEIRLPRELLGRFQTLEYIRSFMAGRTGWARIGALMIISGAFGLFRKQDVIDVHGYMTGSGYFSKDTVAEDMELVVRISRLLRERKQSFAVNYAYNANCWTEVPSTHRILRSQRDRWQRGLIDTMFFHLRMLFNPRYKAIGMIGYPYYFFFELLGPWIEVQGLALLIGGLIGGAIGFSLFAIVLAATVGMGVAISLCSLLLAEYHTRYFLPIDRLRLLLLAVAENVGYRQYAGLLRLRGYISALAKRTGWGTMVRAGFAQQTPHGPKRAG